MRENYLLPRNWEKRFSIFVTSRSRMLSDGGHFRSLWVEFTEKNPKLRIITERNFAELPQGTVSLTSPWMHLDDVLGETVCRLHGAFRTIHLFDHSDSRQSRWILSIPWSLNPPVNSTSSFRWLMNAKGCTHYRCDEFRFMDGRSVPTRLIYARGIGNFPRRKSSGIQPHSRSRESATRNRVCNGTLTGTHTHTPCTVPWPRCVRTFDSCKVRMSSVCCYTQDDGPGEGSLGRWNCCYCLMDPTESYSSVWQCWMGRQNVTLKEGTNTKWVAVRGG